MNVEHKGIHPSARFAHTATTHKSSIYVFGGQGPFQSSSCSSTSDGITEKLTSMNCMYLLETNTMQWSRVTDELSIWPPPRNSHSSVFCKHDECIVIFGGANELVGPMNDVWCFSIKNKERHWTQINCNGDEDGVVPAPREMHSACFADNKNCMYVVGGRNKEGGICQDLWSLDWGTSFYLCFNIFILRHFV